MLEPVCKAVPIKNTAEAIIEIHKISFNHHRMNLESTYRLKDHPFDQGNQRQGNQQWHRRKYYFDKIGDVSNLFE